MMATINAKISQREVKIRDKVTVDLSLRCNGITNEQYIQQILTFTVSSPFNRPVEYELKRVIPANSNPDVEFSLMYVLAYIRGNKLCLEFFWSDSDTGIQIPRMEVANFFDWS